MARLKKSKPIPAPSPPRKTTPSPSPPPPSEQKKTYPSSLPPSLEALAKLISEREYLLATEEGDERLATGALDVVKGVFDLGLSLEKSSHPHLHPLLKSILSAPSASTRSSVAKKSQTTKPTSDPSALLPYTPLDALYVEGMDMKQVWQQMELRGGALGSVLKEIGVGASMEDGEEDEEGHGRKRGQGDDEDDEDDDEEDDEELDLDDPTLTPEEKKIWEKLLKERPEMFSEREEGSDHEDDLYDSEDDDDENSEEDDDEEDDESDEDEESDSRGLQARRGGSNRMEIDGEDDDGLYDDMEDEDMEGFSDLEDDEMEDEEDEEEEDIENDDEFGEEAYDDEEDDLDAPPRKGPSHPTLDDRFFSIDEFNALTEQAEAGKVGSGSLGSSSKAKAKGKGVLVIEEGEEEDSEDEDDEMGEGGDLAALLASGDVLDGGDGVNGDMMYSDFFAPPPKVWTKENPNKAKNDGKGKDNTNDKPKGKGKGTASATEAGDDQMEVEVDDEPTDLRSTMHRVRTDLFADDEEIPTTNPLSSHQKRQLLLSEQIASLEQENIGPKDWTLMGEVKARERPENGLLEEELDFESSGKVVPLITEERVMSLEEVIKKRILDENFDDIVRRREIDDKAFLPSRYFELQDTQATKSLAQIYEDEYTAGASGGKVVDARDVKLSKDHEEIDKLWAEISYKLDALSNLNFTPKQPKATITTISNVATTTLESALPTTQSTSSMLAPEELFAPPSSSSLVARSELDSTQKRRARQKSRKQKMNQRQALDSAVDKFAGKGGGGGKARGGVKAQKDRALEELVKTGKGVTVVGKDPVRKRGTRPEASPSAPSASLKL